MTSLFGVSSAKAWYNTGDYWLIPARTATNNVEWPVDGTTGDPLPQPPPRHQVPGRPHRHALPALYRRALAPVLVAVAQQPQVDVVEGEGQRHADPAHAGCDFARVHEHVAVFLRQVQQPETAAAQPRDIAEIMPAGTLPGGSSRSGCSFSQPSDTTMIWPPKFGLSARFRSARIGTAARSSVRTEASAPLKRPRPAERG